MNHRPHVFWAHLPFLALAPCLSIRSHINALLVGILAPLFGHVADGIQRHRYICPRTGVNECDLHSYLVAALHAT
jgi:hypothetical protein